MDARDLRVVLVHDWLTGMRGGEKVLEVMCRRWPHAPLYTLLHKRGSVSPAIEQLPIRTSFLQWFPGVSRYYRYLLPLMPWAVNWRIPECDLVLSSSHCVAKGVTAPAGAPHVCYCHTPMRYAWSLRGQYFGENDKGLKSWARAKVLDRLQEWDRRTAQGVTHFIANSRVVQQRILEYYGRSSVVIHPPVDTDYYCPAPVAREDYYLVFSAFAPYKRLDLAIAACNQLKKRLVVIGSGQAEKKLRDLAGPTVTFLGYQPDEAVRDHLRRCQALLFPGEEDFGIVPLEAQACGTPVIAFGRGGATETVVPLEGSWAGKPTPATGVWFAEQTPECLGQAILLLEKERHHFDAQALRKHALRFNGQRFAEELFAYLDSVVQAPDLQRKAA
jgi:glycosyltransferase involved in cell wall biosynthesis